VKIRNWAALNKRINAWMIVAFLFFALSGASASYAFWQIYDISFTMETDAGLAVCWPLK